MKHGQLITLPNTYNAVDVYRIYTKEDYEKMTFKQSLIFEEHFRHVPDSESVYESYAVSRENYFSYVQEEIKGNNQKRINKSEL